MKKVDDIYGQQKELEAWYLQAMKLNLEAYNKMKKTSLLDPLYERIGFLQLIESLKIQREDFQKLFTNLKSEISYFLRK